MKQPDPIGTSRKISAIPYYGGKFRLARHIVPIIESIPHSVYCEPCIGGASVFLWRSPDDSKVEVINDINSDIVNMYRAFKLYPKTFIRTIQSIPYSIELYKECSEIRKNNPSLLIDKTDLINVGCASYFNVCSTFGNITRPSACNIDRTGRTNYAKQWQRKKDNIQTVINRFANVYIEHNDLLETIKRWDSKNTLFYIDPPYVGTDNTGYYGLKYDTNDLIKLMELLSIIKGKYILSSPDIGIIPDGCITRLFTIQNGIQGSSHREELIYTNSSL